MSARPLPRRSLAGRFLRSPGSLGILAPLFLLGGCGDGAVPHPGPEVDGGAAPRTGPGSAVEYRVAPEASPERVIRDGIEAHGGARFSAMEATFGFRGDAFRVRYHDGAFAFERTVMAPRAGLAPGEVQVDRMDNAGTSRKVGGDAVALTPEAQRNLETDLNSVVYFAFLPWRLEDPAVRLRDLGEGQLNGTRYRKIEVTFEAEGGGRDWEDRFIYWFHPETHLLDFLAYRFHTGDGGTRFREAANRREVGGLVVQDWLNFTADPEVDDIARYDELFEAGLLRLVSRVELEDLRIEPLGPLRR